MCQGNAQAMVFASQGIIRTQEMAADHVASAIAAVRLSKVK